MTTFVTYSPNDVIILVNQKTVVGWESVTVSLSEENSVHMGINGSGRHVSTLRKDGTCSIELTDFSPSNTEFQLFQKLGIPVMISIVDKTTAGAAFVTDNAKLAKKPDFVRGGEGGTNEWVWNFVSGEIAHAGARR